jgi:NADH-quinone oxidoreductase subunit G
VGESRPGWKVLRVLGNLLDLQGFDYETSEEVRDQLRGIAGAAAGALPATTYAGGWVPAGQGTGVLTSAPMYQVDPVVRRAPALQQTRDGRTAPAPY